MIFKNVMCVIVTMEKIKKHKKKKKKKKRHR